QCRAPHLHPIVWRRQPVLIVVSHVVHIEHKSRPFWTARAGSNTNSVLNIRKSGGPAMVTVAHRIDVVPRAASFSVSFPSPVRALIASCCAYLRPRRYEASITATATIIVFIATIVPMQLTSNTVHLYKPLAQRAAAIKNLRLASHPYIECSLTSAARLAFQPEIPELVAIAAIRQCADQGKHLS